MAESAVSFLLDQLSLFLREEKQLLGGLEREIKYIRDEMAQMNEFLRVAIEKDESEPNLKEWIRQLREIAYDVEDVLDRYILQFGRRGGGGGNGFRGRMKEAYASIKHLKARHHIASEIQAIKYRLQNVSTSQLRYRDMNVSMDQGSSSVLGRNESYDGRGDALFLDEDDVVGIEQPKKQLLEWIHSVDDGLEVISVVGMGGLGKTTLVKKVYDDESVKRRFDQRVWIVPSEYKDVKHLLASLIEKLVDEAKEAPPRRLPRMSIDEMREYVYEFLRGKDCMIVLDDVWNASTWDAIRFALPKRGGHGCIIITTRFNSIGNAACCETGHVYNLEPLREEESRELFYKKAFPKRSCPHYVREYAENVLRRCEGLPLAISVIGGVLATKDDNAEVWEVFERSLDHELKGGGSLENLGRLLSLSYNDLPYNLKYCYLYLSIFPEDALLEKEKIVRLWIAEGFVQPQQNKIVEEVAVDCLNDLFGRSLIQVAERHVDGRARAFRIHDLLRDFIVSKSREHNVVSIYNGEEMQWPSRVRRLVVHKSLSFSHETYGLDCLRSLLLFCSGELELGMINEMVDKCRLLKVLDLRRARLETIPDAVFKLYFLKYLSLRSTLVKVIPKSIKYLVNLETLDLKYCNVTELPIEILKLHRLRHLLVYSYKCFFSVSFDNVVGFKAPYEIGTCLPSLLKLCCIEANDGGGIKIVREIGKLIQLRRLSVTKLRSEDGKDLCSSVAKLTNLRSLIVAAVEEGVKMDLDYSIRLPFLRYLFLNGCIERVPNWIRSLNGLTTLILAWSRLGEDPLNCLQDLPKLTRLYIHGACVEGLRFKAQGFGKLKVLWVLDLQCLKWVIVEKGSMSSLEELSMSDCKLLTELPQGIEHLPNLQVLDFGNMAREFVARVAAEKRKEGVSWRSAHVANVGNWRFAFRL